MKKYLLGLCLLCFLFADLQGQGFAFGAKGGLLVGFQKWDYGSQRDALLSWHGIAFIESTPEESDNSVFAQLGYHVRGGAVRTRSRTVRNYISGDLVDLPGRSDLYKFKNLSLSLGAKQKYGLGTGNNKFYYFLGLRGDFTIGTNLEDYERYNLADLPFYPIDRFVRKINYGVIVGGGIELEIAELVGTILEISINPDFSDQYRQPPITGVPSPFPSTSTQLIDISERKLKNVSIELTAGFRFLRKIEYID